MLTPPMQICIDFPVMTNRWNSWRGAKETKQMCCFYIGNNFLLEKRKNNSASLRSRLESRRSHRGAAAADREWCCLKLFTVGDQWVLPLPSITVGPKHTRAHVDTHPCSFCLPADVCFCSGYSFVRPAFVGLTVLYSFHVLWKSRLPSSLRWMTVHPPPALSMLQYTYRTYTCTFMRLMEHLWVLRKTLWWDLILHV